MNTVAMQKKNLNALTLPEKKALAEATYTQPSYFQQLFHHDTTEAACESHAQAFRQEISRLLIERNLIKTEIPLENLHTVLSDEMRAYNFNDGVNKISTYFYDTDAGFLAAYHNFIKFLRQSFLKEPFFFQATPTIRIHCPNSLNSNHYPRYHSDISYGHPPQEINIWLPLTAIQSGHGFRIMDVTHSREMLESFDYDFTALIDSAISDKSFTKDCDERSFPVTTPFGSFIAFDSRCIHTGEPLKSHTRVSMDIRILPISQYEKMSVEYQGSGRRKVLFTPGHCYDERDSEYFLNAKEI